MKPADTEVCACLYKIKAVEAAIQAIRPRAKIGICRQLKRRKQNTIYRHRPVYSTVLMLQSYRCFLAVFTYDILTHGFSGEELLPPCAILAPTVGGNVACCYQMNCGIPCVS